MKICAFAHENIAFFNLFAQNVNMKTITINDIARELGLSRNTVSKVLNGKEMPEKTRKIVLAKAAEMNYKQLSGETNKHYRFLLLSAKPLSNINFFIPIIRTVENSCFEKGYQLFQYVCKQNENEKYLKDYISNLNIDGLICIETFEEYFIKTILSLNIPVVFLDGAVDSKETYDIVVQDNYKTIKEEVSRLIDAGIKSFGFVGDIKHCMSFNNRYEAMLSETGKRDIYHDSSMDFLFPDGSEFYRDTSKMLIEIRKKKALCEAYVCANDFIARKFINVLLLLHKYCPKDVKIIGFDNAPEAVSAKPYITTTEVLSSELGEMLLSTLILRIKNPDRAKIKIVVNTQLVRHDSTQTNF